MDRRLLRGALGAYGQKGFHLNEGDPDIVVLEFEGNPIGRYNATKVTIRTLRADCAKYLLDRPALLKRM